MKYHSVRIFLIAIFSFGWGFLAKAIDFEKPLFEQKSVQTLVQDYAGFLTKEQNEKIEAKLNQLSRENSVQILFVTVNNLFGYDKNDYAARLGIAWKVGSKENNGIVFLIKPKQADSKGEVSIQVGYGLEDVIPDAIAKRIVEAEVIPEFKKGKNFKGVDNALNVLIDISKGKYSSEKYMQRTGGDNSGQWIPLIFIGFFLILFFVLRIKSAQRYSIGHHVPFWVAMSMMGSSHSGSSGGFGNFSSGSGSFGGGGFGGFGGGSFGGGGAGGSW
ncbi:MAG: TPM domain-containing protein [Bacteroidales bacterium]|nr:TPM domain-containing protein [Bacteroidales bacterium]